MFWDAMPTEDDFLAIKSFKMLHCLKYNLYFVPAKPEIK
jgi:hypothetical protein